MTVITAIIASFFDIRWRVLPNLLTIPVIIIGLLLHTLDGGLAGLSSSFTGMLLGSFLFFVLFFCRWMGAGDVKLAAAMGALIGSTNIIPVVFLMVMSGGILGIVYLFLNKRDPLKIYSSVPYGVAISAGAILHLMLI